MVAGSPAVAHPALYLQLVGVPGDHVTNLLLIGVMCCLGGPQRSGVETQNGFVN